MKKSHQELEVEMNQMKELADEFMHRYFELQAQYNKAWREAMVDEYVDEGERHSYLMNMGCRVLASGVRP